MLVNLSETQRATPPRPANGGEAEPSAYGSLLEDLSIGVFRLSYGGEVLAANRALATILGYADLEQIRASNGAALADAIGLSARELRERLEREGGVQGLETSWRRRDGARLCVRINARAVRDPEHPARVLYFEGTIEDVTGRRRAEEQLRERTIYLHALIENNPLAIVVLNSRRMVEMTNRAFTRIFGYRQRELTGRDLDALLAPGEAAAEARRFSERAFSGENVHSVTRRRRRDGRWIDVELFGVPVMVDGRQAGALGIYQDVTERRNQERALRDSQEFLQQTLDSLTAHIAILDARGNIIATNAAWDRFAVQNGGGAACLRANYLEVCDRAAAAGVEEARAAAASIRQVLAGARADFEQEYSCDGPAAGQRRWFQLRVLRFAGEGPVRIVVVHEDITGRRQLEQQLAQTQKMDAIGRLAGGVAHDFNNLLMVISGYAELLVDHFPAGSAGRRQAEEIKRAADRATSLTRQLLTFSRKQLRQPRPLSVDQAVREMEQLLRRLIPENIEIACRLGSQGGVVRADPAQFEQVLMNLAVNAADAMPGGGRLLLETENVTLDEQFCRRLTDVAPGPYVRLTVADTGCGMDAATRARVFEPFFTTKEPGKGTGLGLATVYGIVKQSNGHISIESEPGRGSTFRIYLPRLTEAAEPAPPEIAAEIPRQAGETVLLVEDEDAVREMTGSFLARAGYRVLAAGDGQQALRLARLHPGPIHLLIADVVMPGLGGRELAAQLAELRPEIRVLFASGYPQAAALEGAAPPRHSRFIQKPFKLRRLAEIIRELLRDDGPAAPPPAR